MLSKAEGSESPSSQGHLVEQESVRSMGKYKNVSSATETSGDTKCSLANRSATYDLLGDGLGVAHVCVRECVTHVDTEGLDSAVQQLN